MIPASERAKTVHALDRAATVIGITYHAYENNKKITIKITRLSFNNRNKLNIMQSVQKRNHFAPFPCLLPALARD
jgi:hypothetical protein